MTKARNGAVAIVRQGAERAVDLPVGAALTIRDRVEEAIEPWTTESTRERELKSLRTQVTRELNKFERRGGPGSPQGDPARPFHPQPGRARGQEPPARGREDRQAEPRARPRSS